MKKILISLILTFCLGITMMGVGCSSCTNDIDETQNGGQTEVKKITTLEGVWESEHGRGGEHEKVVVEGSSIRCYINRGVNYIDELRWAGIYVPFTEPISEGEWTFNCDTSWPEDNQEGNISKTFTYYENKLSCDMFDWMGDYKTISFTKVSD